MKEREMEKGMGGGGGGLRMRRNFVKGDREKLFCFGADSVEWGLLSIQHSPLQPSSQSPHCVKDPINNLQSHPDTQKITGRSPAAVSFQYSAVWSQLEAEKHH